MCTPAGRVVYISDVYEGSRHDKTAWNKSNVRTQLQQFYPNAELSFNGITYTLSLGGDKAYPRIRRPPGWHIHTTKTSASAADASDPGCFVDPAIAVHRSVVEQCIGKI